MKLLELNDLELVGLIGSGESGKVYLAKDKQGNQFAVKVYEGMSINRGLLAKAMGRLELNAWPEGVLKFEKLDLEERPAFSVMPYYGDVVETGGKRRLWNLQHRLDQHPGDETWNLIRDIADVMAEMHLRRVVHGNLKPGNVFFDEAGKVQLADWMLGNMPEVSRFGFSDAVLYQSPEQLSDPAGFHEERGYGWDVYAFGALAYRLLTRKFPRCEEVFRDVAPPLGEQCDVTIQAELPRIVKGLLKEPEITWPVETGHVLEKKYRLWIEQCLQLDPAQRPSSMIEVSKAFTDADAEYTEAQARETLVNDRRDALQSKRKAWLAAAGAAAVAVLFVALWLFAEGRLSSEKEDRSVERKRLETDLQVSADDKKLAEDKMDEALAAQRAAEDAVKQEAETGLARLKAMNEVADKLFQWGMEKGHRTLPVLDGREVRLSQLETFYQNFIETHQGNAALAGEVSRARLHLAEISIAAGDAEKAQVRLESALLELEKSETDAALQIRMGRNALLLALLKQRSAKEGLEADFQRARKALLAIPTSGPDADQVREWQAILDFHEARWLADKGDEAKALEQLQRSIRILNELADARPDAAVLRSELAASYLSSASVMDGLGKLSDAHEARVQAATVLGDLLKTKPDDLELMLDLAACYAAMAEASLLAGDVGVAGKFSADATTLLDRVLKQQPESKEANLRKGTQLGIQAGLLRDQGKSAEALKAYEDGIAILDRQEKHPMRDYRLALLNWEKARMLGYSGKKADELKLLIQSNDVLKTIQPGDGLPGTEVLQKSRAYLLGDLALAFEMSKQNDKAKEIYGEAIGLWQSLLKLRPNNEEYRSALDWNRQRVSEF